LTYTAVDSSNNQATSVTRTITVEEQEVTEPLSTDPKAFTFDKSTGTIVGYDSSFGTNPVIPSQIDGVTVRVIGYQAFRSKGLIGVTLPSSLQTISDTAFQSNQITTVTIPDSVTSIGNYAFSSNRITEVTFGRGVRSTGTYSFMGNRIRVLSIPSWITSISTGSFNSNQLEEINLGEGVSSISNAAFAYNSTLRNVTIPAQVSSLSNSAFINTNLTSVIIQGVETRFNTTWTQIGFPGNLMPGLD
jgi:hypothetical protein